MGRRARSSWGWLQHRWVQRYYDLDYVKAKAIAQRDGDAAIDRLIAAPSNAFVRRFVALAQEPGASLPKLGARAAKWAARSSCS